MEFTNSFFLFFFLPISLCVFYMFRKKEIIRHVILLIFSLIFYAYGSPNYFLLLCISMTVTLIIGRKIGRCCEHRIAKVLLVIGICYNVAILVYYKYFDFIIINCTKLVGQEPTGSARLLLPLGLSFFTFKAISYLVDIYKGKISSMNCSRSILYLSFFAQIQSGPLSRYQDMELESTSINTPSEIWNNLSMGFYRFSIGFSKKILLANVLAKISQEVFLSSSTNISVLYAWVGACCYSLQLFFDFSGYSDMAIGISRMFGISCPENFFLPYMSASITEFWRRWHITLGAWFRDYVYIPCGGARISSKKRRYFNLFVVWMLTGLWHGASWKFVFWGMGYFVVILFEKVTCWPKVLKSWQANIYRVFCLLFINFQWVIFGSDRLKSGLLYIKNMLYCQKNQLADNRALFLLRHNMVFIMAAVILCTPLLTVIQEKVLKNGRCIRVGCYIVNAVILVFLFVWSVSFVITGYNNPFAYANF